MRPFLARFYESLIAAVYNFWLKKPSVFLIFTVAEDWKSCRRQLPKKLNPLPEFHRIICGSGDWFIWSVTLLHHSFPKTGKIHTLCRSFFVPHKCREIRHLRQLYIAQSHLSRELLKGGFFVFCASILKFLFTLWLKVHNPKVEPGAHPRPCRFYQNQRSRFHLKTVITGCRFVCYYDLGARFEERNNSPSSGQASTGKIFFLV